MKSKQTTAKRHSLTVNLADPKTLGLQQIEEHPHPLNQILAIIRQQKPQDQNLLIQEVLTCIGEDRAKEYTRTIEEQGYATDALKQFLNMAPQVEKILSERKEQ